MSRGPTSEPTVEEAAAMRDFWLAWDDARERVERRLEVRALDIPELTMLMATTPPAEQRARREWNRVLVRTACLDGNWGPLRDNLRLQGEMYAAAGVEFGAWYSLLVEFRAELRDVIEDKYRDDSSRRRSAMKGEDLYVDWAMTCLTDAYLGRKEALIESAESKLDLYIDVVRNANLGISIHHLDDPTDPGSFRLVEVNPAASRMAGTDRTRDIGRRLRDLSHKNIDPTAAEHYSLALAEQRQVDWEWTRQSDRRVFATRCFPLRGGHVGAITEDISERRRLEDATRATLLDLERSNADLDEFAYVASHDLRAPLRDIDNLAGWVVEDLGTELPAETRRHLEQMMERIHRMERLLEDLLQYSRAGRHRAPAQEFRFSEVVDAVLGLLPIPAGFSCERSGDDLVFVSPRTPLEQVLRNLVDNAIKHHDRSDGRISIHTRDLEGFAEIEVADDGPGIEPRFHQRAFELFKTLKPRDRGAGSGMGLALVKKIVDHHGGSIHIVPAIGRGCTIRFTWPLREPSATEQRP